MSYNRCRPTVFSWKFLFLAVNATLQPCVLLGPKFLRQNDYRLRQSVRWVSACKAVTKYHAVQCKSSQFCDQIWSDIIVLNKYLVFYLRFIVSCADNNGQQRFWPMRKNVCFWCIFGRWIRICFQNFSITHAFCVASDYVTAHAYICESLGACRR